MERASDILGEDGPFSELIASYQVRRSQLELSDAIQSMFEDNTVLVAEAGTGIGKSYAYSVPAVLSGERVVISTGTRHLQDQLFHTDLPTVVSALQVPRKLALLKGRSNYLCLHRLNIAPHLGYMNRDVQSALTGLREWSGVTGDGDISGYRDITEDSYIWPMVTSTAENCIGGECDHYNDCFVVNARKKAQDADIVVINHHLLLADMTLKEEGFAELLPEVDAFVIDEAHQLHDIASRFFGSTISSRQLVSLARDAIAEQLNDAPDMGEIREAADVLERAAGDMRLAMGEQGQRQAWSRIAGRTSVKDKLESLQTALQDLLKVLELAAERSRALDQCAQRAAGLVHTLKRFTGELSPEEEADTAAMILWYETYSKSFMLHATPVDIAELFRQHTDRYADTWLFTSATLQVNQSFDHFAAGLGLEDYRSGVWDSPFDYAEQGLLYLPTDLPEPSDPAFTAQLVQCSLPVIEASEGHAFMLFTSFRALNEASRLIREAIDYPVMVQGDLPKHELLAEFRKTRHAVLLGTSSFWEGVDVRGEALSCVIIDKLPFASPGDPVMQARIDALRRSGRSPFMEYQVPQAVIALKQGVGRLIRDINDTGVVVIGDRRLTSKSYGRVFLNSLPAMTVTHDIDDVTAFYEKKERCDETAIC